MVFQCDGRRYDTDGMRCLDTAGGPELSVYVAADYATVFVLVMDACIGASVRRADAIEIRRLWQVYGFPELQRALDVASLGLGASAVRGGVGGPAAPSAGAAPWRFGE